MTPERLHDFLAHSPEWTLITRWLLKRRERAGDDIDRALDTDTTTVSRHKAIRGFIHNELLHEDFKDILLDFMKEQKEGK